MAEGSVITNIESVASADHFLVLKDRGIGPEGPFQETAENVASQIGAVISLDSVRMGVLSRTVATPPVSPADGDRYIVPAGATGTWVGHAGSIAVYSGSAWTFIMPKAGYSATAIDEWQTYAYKATTSSWVAITSAARAEATLAELTTLMATYPEGAKGEVTNDVISSATVSRARASNVATVVLPAAHGLGVGVGVGVHGLGGTGYNGRVTTLSGTTGSTLVYASTGGNESTTADTAGQVDRNGIYRADGAGGLVWIGDSSVAAQISSAIASAIAAEASARDSAIAVEAAARVAGDAAVRNYIDDSALIASLPAGADALWAIDRYDATAKAIPNLLSTTPLSPNIHRAPRRLFSKLGAYTHTSGAVADDAALDADSISEASTLNLAGGQTCQINTGSLPAGTYTLVCAFRRNIGADQQFRLGSDTSLTYSTFIADASLTRRAFTFALVSSANPQLVIRTIDGSTAAALQIVDLELFAGGADLGKSPIDSHIYLGKSRYDTATTGSYASGKLDLSGGGFGLVQFPVAKSYSKFTAHWLCAKKATGGDYHAFLSRAFNFSNFSLYNELSHALTVAIGGESNPGYISQRQNIPRALTGDGFHSITVRYDDPILDIWFDDFLLLRVSTSPQHGVGTLVPQSIRDLYFGIVNNFGNSSSYEYAGFSALYPSSLTNDGVRSLHSANKARAAKSGISLAAAPEMIHIAEGDSLSSASTDYDTYPVQLIPNYSQRTYSAIHAVTGSFISSLTTRGPFADAVIKPVGVRGSEVYVLSVMIGTNDFTSGSFDQTAWLASYASYLDARRAAGFKVIVGTVIANINALVNTRRASVNPILRTWVGTHCDAIMDFAADAIMGADASASNPTYFKPDGIHGTTAGQAILETIARPVINAY